MANKLSFSQINRYTQCGESYRLHYKEKIKPNVQTGALLFGSALDNAINQLLLPKGDKTPEEIMVESFTFAEVNNVNTYIPLSLNLVYSNSDFDEEILTPEDHKTIKTSIDELQIITKSDDYISYFLELKKQKETKGIDDLTDDEKRFYNYLNWVCLLRKGYLMLDAYRLKVLPKIIKPLEVQKKVVMNNHTGDEVVGYVDLIAEIKDEGIVILDNKTSAISYSYDSAKTSPQLALYMHLLYDLYKTRKVGFIVMRKNVKKNRVKMCSSCGYDGSTTKHKSCNNEIDNKRCGGAWNETIKPEIDIQIIIDEISPIVEEMILDNFDIINYAINKEIFPKNLQTCNNYYGGKCPYYNLCYYKSKKGLTNG